MDDLIVDFSDFRKKQSASSSKSKTKLKVRFSKTSRLYVITRATLEEARRVWNSSKEMADMKRHFDIRVRMTWQMMDDTEVRSTIFFLLSKQLHHSTHNLTPYPICAPIQYDQIQPADKEIFLYNCMGMEYHLSPEATHERRAKHAQAVLETQARQRRLGYDDDIEIGHISSVSSKNSRKRAHHIALLYHKFLSNGR